MKTENFEEITIAHDDYLIIGKYDVNEDVSILCGERSRNWKPRKVLLLKKNGNVRKVDYGFNKPLYISLVEGVNKDNLQEALSKGDAIKLTVDDMMEICKEIGYFHEPTVADFDDIISWLFITDEGQFKYYEMERCFTKAEKKIMEDEEDKGLIKCFVELIQSSERIWKCMLYLTGAGLMSEKIDTVINYLKIKDYDDFVDFMYISDYDKKNNPDDLMDKYDICEDVEAVKDNGVFSKNEVSLRCGRKYIMTTSIRSSFDDWDGFCVIARKSTLLSYTDVAKLGESLYWFESDVRVRFGVVI